MSVAKIVEITAESEKSFEDAIRKGIKRASKTVKNIQGAWVKDQKLTVKKGEVTAFRVMMKVTFLLDD